MSQMTKRALEASLKHLLLQKPLNKITINDIAEDCGINRMTFYYHFKDIYDLVEWACAEDAARVYRCVSRERIEQYLSPLIRRLILGVVEEKAAGLTVSEEDKRFIAGFYEHAFVGVMLEWIGNNMKDDPAEIVERTSKMIRGSVIRALRAFSAE